jgi:hypothetical protein
MNYPCLEEMGDIAPALKTLLKLQAEYARRDPDTSRAMRDVAWKAVEAEIHRYIDTHYDRKRPTIEELQRILGNATAQDAAVDQAKED